MTKESVLKATVTGIYLCYFLTADLATNVGSLKGVMKTLEYILSVCALTAVVIIDRMILRYLPK